eukprot:TRINITY_DN2079_c0_g1_i1.p1 TRINITY_DN2079_c0_g1~~TRINITY_DN2079_c0_g1_i1.p1  ORF type:complete len:394 (-),score=74.06 TRINITY_DN2079_c0_g1_i1:91-1272(-)
MSSNLLSGILDQPMITLNDVITVLILSIAIYIIKRVIDSIVLIPIGKLFNINDPMGIKKFIENAWYTLYYALMLSYGYYALNGKNFFPWKAEHYFPADHYSDWTVYPELKVYYVVQTAFYLQASFCLIFETKRKDFLQYCLHHAATISLLLFSYMAAQQRMGFNILFLHDISDVLLYGTKVLHYIDIYGGHRKADSIGRVLFIIFAISFFVTRLYLFPMRVIFDGAFTQSRFDNYSSSWYFMRLEPGINNQSLAILNHERFSVGGMTFSPQYILLILMIVLIFLHLFWGFLILRMISKFFIGNLNQDIRSDDEDEKIKKEKINKEAMKDQDDNYNLKNLIADHSHDNDLKKNGKSVKNGSSNGSKNSSSSSRKNVNNSSNPTPKQNNSNKKKN